MRPLRRKWECDFEVPLRNIIYLEHVAIEHKRYLLYNSCIDPFSRSMQGGLTKSSHPLLISKASRQLILYSFLHSLIELEQLRINMCSVFVSALVCSFALASAAPQPGYWEECEARRLGTGDTLRSKYGTGSHLQDHQISSEGNRKYGLGSQQQPPQAPRQGLREPVSSVAKGSTQTVQDQDTEERLTPGNSKSTLRDQKPSNVQTLI